VVVARKTTMQCITRNRRDGEYRGLLFLKVQEGINPLLIKYIKKGKPGVRLQVNRKERRKETKRKLRNKLGQGT